MKKEVRGGELSLRGGGEREGHGYSYAHIHSERVRAKRTSDCEPLGELALALCWILAGVMDNGPASTKMSSPGLLRRSAFCFPGVPAPELFLRWHTRALRQRQSDDSH